MKRALLIYAVLMLSIWASAQTQQGYVKTLGRPDKAGEPLGGVSIRVKGSHNEVLSNSDGTFTMELKGKKNGEAYALQSVQKVGYELNESDIVGRQFAFSNKVPLTIVMVSSSVLQAEKRRIEDNAYRTAEKNYKAKYNLLEKQLNDNEITIEQYREQIQDLQDKFEKYQSLIDGLAEHYAHTDYDMLSEKDREINLCIENGDLERADSLINTLFDPIGVLERNMKALASIEQQIGQAQGIIDQANEDMAAVLKQQEKDAEYLYQLYTIALARYDNEKAQQYIVTRALLDTTNAHWQTEAAYYLVRHNDFEQAEHFYDLAIVQYRSMDEDELVAHKIDMSYALSDLGNIYTKTNRSNQSEALFKEALKIANEALMSENKQAYAPKIHAMTNLAVLYFNSQRISEAWDIYFEGFQLFSNIEQDSILMSNPSLMGLMMSMLRSGYRSAINSYAVSPELANQILNSIPDFSAMQSFFAIDEEEILVFSPTVLPMMQLMADLYLRTQQYQKCEALLTKALELSRKMAKADPEANNAVLIEYLECMATYYSKTERLDESEACHEEALALCRQLVADHPIVVFYSRLFDILYNLGDLCITMGVTNQDPAKLQKGENLLNEALGIMRELTRNDPQRSEQGLYKILMLLGELYLNINDMTQDFTYLTQCEQLFLESIDIVRRLAKNAPEVYEPDLAQVLMHLGGLYYTLGGQSQDTAYYIQCEKAYTESIEIMRRLTDDNPQVFQGYLARNLIDYGNLFRNWGKFDQCEPIYEEALSIWHRLASQDPKQFDLALAEALLHAVQYKLLSGQFDNAVRLAEETVEIYKRHQQDAGMLYFTALSMLGESYSNVGEYKKAYHAFNELSLTLKSMTLDSNLTYEYMMCLGNLSFTAIFMEKFAEAEQCAREALQIDISQTWIFTNLAAALLFQGKYDEALEIYNYLKPESKDALLDDLNAFEKAGIIPKKCKADVERIRQMLME